jgi:hypothetical protein
MQDLAYFEKNDEDQNLKLNSNFELNKNSIDYFQMKYKTNQALL